VPIQPALPVEPAVLIHEVPTQKLLPLENPAEEEATKAPGNGEEITQKLDRGISRIYNRIPKG